MSVVKIRKWGNSLGVVLPRELVECEQLAENQVVRIEVRKESAVKNLFGSVRFGKSGQAVKNDIRKGWK